MLLCCTANAISIFNSDTRTPKICSRTPSTYKTRQYWRHCTAYISLMLQYIHSYVNSQVPWLSMKWCNSTVVSWKNLKSWRLIFQWLTPTHQTTDKPTWLLSIYKDRWSFRSNAKFLSCDWLYLLGMGSFNRDPMHTGWLSVVRTFSVSWLKLLQLRTGNTVISRNLEPTLPD